MLIKIFPKRESSRSVWLQQRMILNILRKFNTNSEIKELRNQIVKKNLNKWKDTLCSWKMQHTKDINFPQIETTRFFPQNSHTQTKLQTYEFIILGVKPRHLLFQEKKKPYPYPGHSDLQLTMPVSPVTISRVMGLRVLFSNCPPS